MSAPHESAIAPPLLAMLDAQERFEAIRKRAFAQHPRTLCDLSYANATDAPPDGVREALIEAASSTRVSDFQYTPYGGSVIPRRLVARHLARVHDVPFELPDVVLTPGAMAALNLVFRALRTAERDEAIVVTPCWLDHPLYLENHGYEVRFAAVRPGTMRLDLDRIAALITSRTRLLVLSQPSNPTGVVYSRDELTLLGRLLEASPSRPMLVSDECHRDFVFGPPAPSPAARNANTCVVYSFGKKLLMQGQRLGFVAVSPRADHAARLRGDLERWARITGFCTPTALMQRALGAMIDRAPPVDRVARRSALLRDALRASGYVVPEPEGTFFLYPEVPGDDVAFCALLAELGVLTLPARAFHHQGHVRLSVTASDDAIERAIPIFARARSALGPARRGAA